MIEEYSMHRLTDIVVAPEGETEVGYTTTDMCAREVLTYPFCSPDEVGSIGIMLLHTRCDGKDIWVEDNVVRVHPYPLSENAISPLCNLDTSFIARGLPLLIEAHHHHSCPIAHHVESMFDELLLTFLQRDGVDDALTLDTFQTCHNDVPVGGVDHHRHLCDVGFCSNHIEECLHLCLGIEQTIIHVDIDNESPVFHLFSGNGKSLIVILFFYKSKEFSRTSHVTTLTDIDKLYFRRHIQQFQSR